MEYFSVMKNDKIIREIDGARSNHHDRKTDLVCFPLYVDLSHSLEVCVSCGIPITIRRLVEGLGKYASQGGKSENSDIKDRRRIMKQEDLNSVVEEGHGKGSNAERDVGCYFLLFFVLLKACHPSPKQITMVSCSFL